MVCNNAQVETLVDSFVTFTYLYSSIQYCIWKLKVKGTLMSFFILIIITLGIFCYVKILGNEDFLKHTNVAVLINVGTLLNQKL